MAERRMFTDKITESDVFLDMPLSTQALYMHFCMNADDDGFVKNPKRIQKMVGASDDDSDLLILKRFTLSFKSGVIAIKHWRMHNLLRKDRYKPTEYIEEKSMLKIKENGAYTFDETQGKSLMATSWQPNDNQMATQVSIELGKDSIEVSKKESNKQEDYLSDTRTRERMSYDEIFECFEVDSTLKMVFIEFIRHCALNGRMLTNDKLGQIIVKLDEVHDKDEQAKIDSLRNAISGGYYDIIENRR